MIILYGAGQHSKVVADILLQRGVMDFKHYDQYCTFDQLNGIEVFRELPKLQNSDSMILCIGNNKIRMQKSAEVDVNFTTLIHPFSAISKNVTIGQGTVVMAGAVINSDVQIGCHCIINTSASIDHDCKIADFAHISPGVTLCGDITVGVGTHIGAGATIIPGIKIGRWAIVGAGSVVIRDVPDFAKVVGNPARLLQC